MTTQPLREAAQLLADLNAATWQATADERALAEGLAFAGLSASSLRAALRQAPPGRLAAALEPVTTAMESTVQAVDEDELLVLRQLLDALALPPYSSSSS
ncbi:hypothetical protein ABZ502_17410 [Streptomyces abikoensis]|uniref:hypothetical protein n=1 Tax=Streptomyces abikoensis TaxID=97398 RepID=UPI0033F0961B